MKRAHLMARPRFHIRTLMIAVAVVGMTLGAGVELLRRRERFQTLADHYRSQQGEFRIYETWYVPTTI